MLSRDLISTKPTLSSLPICLLLANPDHSAQAMSTTFQLLATQGAARAGLLDTPHGQVPTPAFMPVATQASVKTLAPDELTHLGAAILLGNAYHLYLRPGVETVREMGGLGAFMGWDGPTLTDSGGFQAYSLESTIITDQGLAFSSHVDGSRHLFTPENAVTYQQGLGADIIMSLDQCLAYTQDKEAARDAMERTHRWAERCRTAHHSDSQVIFGIVQGGVFTDLRAESAAFVTGLDFSGYAIGGLAVGEPKDAMYRVVAHTTGLLPQDKTRYLMGVGSPEDLVECVARGVDIFDCALPTRVARHGALFTHQGRVNVYRSEFRGSHRPVEDGCDCYTCARFSTGYLHHLFKSGEFLGHRLATIHNLRFIMRLMEEMQAAVVDNTFDAYAMDFLRAYQPANEETRSEQTEKWLASRAGNY